MQSLAQQGCHSPAQRIDRRNVEQLARHTIRPRRIEENLALIPTAFAISRRRYSKISIRALRDMNVGKPIDFSACAFGADERKPVGQVWLLYKRNLDPTVGASHGSIGLGGNH